MDPVIDHTASGALSAVRDARLRLADRLDEGSWRYDLAYSAIAGLSVAGQALPLGVNVLASAVGTLALALLARDWARRKGVWVCGVTPRRARWVSVGLGGALVTLCGVVFLTTSRGGSGWIAAPAGLIAAAAALVASRLWRRAFRRDLEEDFGHGGRLSTGLFLILGVAGLAAAGVAALLHADGLVTGWVLGVGIGMSAMAGALMLRRRGNRGAVTP